MRFVPSLLNKRGSVTVALSMGADSLAITHFLRYKLPKLSLSCFHFNHKLRPQNDDMERAAVDFCKDIGVPLTIKERLGGGTDEASLREARYGAMSGLGTIVTGHHLDDAVESYLMNCFKGNPEYLPIPVITPHRNGIVVVRPFILTTKSEINDYADKNSLNKWLVEDETNEDQSYRRNWVRHSIVPQITDKGYGLRTIVRKKYLSYFKDQKTNCL